MSEYYIHKVGYNEMGSISKAKTKKGKKKRQEKRNPFFLVGVDCLDFFPHLSSVSLNDKLPLYVVRTFNGIPKLSVCIYDYHNSKFSDLTFDGANPRNEVRLYLNVSVNPKEDKFKEGDIAVFEKCIDGNDGEVYILTRVTPKTKGYKTLDAYLNEFGKFKKNNALFSGELPFIPKIVLDDSVELTLEQKENELFQKALKECENRLTQESEVEDLLGSHLFNKASFRRFVLFAYDYKCAITGEVIRYGDFMNLEAAHIKPSAHQGKFLPCNGIAMGRDFHYAYDKGFFMIDDDYNIIVADELKDTPLYNYHGKRLNLPKCEAYRPHQIFLHHHAETVFRTFKQIRK